MTLRKHFWIFVGILLASDAAAQLRITGSAEDTKLCYAEGHKDDLRLDLVLRLTIVNTGAKSIIVNKSSPGVSGDAFSADTAAPQEREWSHSDFMVIKTKKVAEFPSTPSNGFVVLERGSQIEARLDYRTFPTLQELKHARYLHLRLFTIWSKEEMDVLQSKWWEFGDLWRQGLDPEPIPFSLPKRLKVSQCPQ
jgi:hypothetical protein